MPAWCVCFHPPWALQGLSQAIWQHWVSWYSTGSPGSSSCLPAVWEPQEHCIFQPGHLFWIRITGILHPTPTELAVINGRPLHDWGFVSVVVSHLLALLERAQETQYWAPTVSRSKLWPLPLCSMDHEGSLCRSYPSSLSLWNSGHYRLRIFPTSLVEQDSDLNSLVKGLSCSG